MAPKQIRANILGALLVLCAPNIVLSSEKIVDVEVRVRGPLDSEADASGESSFKRFNPTKNIKSAAEDIIERIGMNFVSIHDEAWSKGGGQKDGLDLFCVKRAENAIGFAPEFLGFRRDSTSKSLVKDWEKYRHALTDALDFFSKHLVALDIREARLQKSRYQDFRLFTRLNSLRLPLNGVDLEELAESLPPSLEYLEITKSGVSANAISTLNRLPGLKSLTFRNCWADGIPLLPADRRALEELSSPPIELIFSAKLELDHLFGQIKELRFIGCDENLTLIATMGGWNALEVVEIDPRGEVYGIHQIVRHLAPGREDGAMFFPAIRKMVIHVDASVVTSMKGRTPDFPQALAKTLSSRDPKGSEGFDFRVKVTPH